MRMFNTFCGVPVSLLLLSVLASYVFFSESNKTDAFIYLKTLCTFPVRSSQSVMANNGLIFVSNATKVHSVCQKASRFVQKVLYIKINGPSEGNLSVLSRQIANLYSKASLHCNNLDVRLMLKPSDTVKTIYPIDLIMYENVLEREIDRLKQGVANQIAECKTQCLDTLDQRPDTGTEEEVKTYEYVALGGTFDRLHNGHKILLSQAVLRATKHVTVGVCDINMIKSKKLFELIEPVDKRIEAVLSFLKDINPDLEYNVLPIQDMYGPTKDDPKFQLIVVSEETVRGAVKINDKRKENGLQPLETHVIGLAEDDMRKSEEEEAKLSSSNQRMRMLGTVLKPPQPNPDIPDWPYVIGLAGGIASGKSNITKKLQAKGAGVVNCDHIGHDLYKPGLPLNRTISETFGRDVITEAGEVDRKKLGEIVFSDKAQLDKLNRIIWPEIIKEAERQVQVLGQQGHKVVVIEAAVMVRAQWYRRCHQLWAVIIPPEEAVKRLMHRNNLSPEEARRRIEAQPSNVEQVALANVVFSPFWSYEYTQGQIDRAWEHLQQYLSNRKTVEKGRL